MKELPKVERNELRKIECESWDDFKARMRKDWPFPTEEGWLTADLVLYRGQRDPDWRLWSRLERSLVMYGKAADGTLTMFAARETHGLEWYDRYCAQILEKFKQHAQGLLRDPTQLSDDEFWALGRHHGLLTPLLDWTESPYVAAYFAFDDYRRSWEHGAKSHSVPPEGDPVAVWGLRFWEDLEIAGEFEVLRSAPPSAARQRAQRGIFTRLRSKGHQDVLSYLKDRGLAHCLELYTIPMESALDALRDLQLMNITPATLFPDIEGAADQANLDMASLRFAAFGHDFQM